tara:strand:+ start:6635 stop:6760 length:126 start_codon:yes stop_codon:yes gene_type:complete
MSNGKGDVNRPKTVDNKTWEKNYERIFKKSKPKSDKKKKNE